jgi:hypothetical protein
MQEQDISVGAASRRRKWFFWIIMGVLSTFFAEVTAGSTPLPFFSLPGLLLVFPLYFLHTLFFFCVVWSFGRPTLAALYTAGMLFGMYEAYLTKVVWTSYSPDGPMLTVAGIALFETLLLVMFWHSVLAFMLPVFIAETCLTRSREIVGLLPGWVRRRGRMLLVLLLLWGGLFTSVNSPSVVRSVLSTFGSGAVVLVLMVVWKRTGGARYGMRDLLPGSKGRVAVAVAMGLMYVGYTRILEWDKLPGWGPQVTVWVIYAGLIWLLVRNLRRSRDRQIRVSAIQVGWKTPVLFLLLYVAMAIVGELLRIEIPLIVVSFASIIFPGAFLLYVSIRDVNPGGQYAANEGNQM